MRLDTGATRTAIPGRLVKDHQYTGGQVQATLADMSVTNLREAKVKVGVEGEVVTLNVIVLKEDAPEILLGTDHPVTRSLLTNRKIKLTDPVPTKARAITRAQSHAQSKGMAENKAADARDNAHPKTPSTQCHLPQWSNSPSSQGDGVSQYKS